MTGRDELLRALAKRRKQAQLSPLNTVLDSLNAFGALEDYGERAPESLLCFGPKAISGKTWSAVVVWQRPPGYYNYKTLTLLGIWAWGELEGTRIIIGTRQLDYLAPYYVPDAYFKHIRKDFAIYYGSDVPPPDTPHQLYTALYESGERLALRREIEAVLNAASLS